MYLHDLNVMSSNPSWVELGVRSTSALICTGIKKNSISLQSEKQEYEKKQELTCSIETMFVHYSYYLGAPIQEVTQSGTQRTTRPHPPLPLTHTHHTHTHTYNMPPPHFSTLSSMISCHFYYVFFFILKAIVKGN